MGIDHNNTNGRNSYGSNDQYNNGGGGYGTSSNVRRYQSHRNENYMNAPHQMYDPIKRRFLKYGQQNNHYVAPGVPKPMVQPFVTVKPAPTSMQTSYLSPSENKAAKAPLATSWENDIPGWGDVLRMKEGKNVGWGTMNQVDDKYC